MFVLAANKVEVADCYIQLARFTVAPLDLHPSCDAATYACALGDSFVLVRCRGGAEQLDSRFPRSCCGPNMCKRREIHVCLQDFLASALFRDAGEAIDQDWVQKLAGKSACPCPAHA